MKHRELKLFNTYRLTCYTAPSFEDIALFMKTKTGRLFHLFLTRHDNTGYHFILQQPIDRNYCHIKQTPEEAETSSQPIVKYAHLKQNRTDSTKLNWIFNVYEYIASSQEAIDRYKETMRGKYIHIAHTQQNQQGQILLTVFKRAKGYERYGDYFTLSDEEYKAYREAKRRQL